MKRCTNMKKYVQVGTIPDSDNVVVFDIDGVLIDCTERLKLSLSELGVNNLSEINKTLKKKFWEIFLSPKYIDYDTPNPEAIDWCRKRHREGYSILLLTGRPENLITHTVNQLNRFNTPYHSIVFRPTGVFEKDYVFKENVIKELGMRVVELHDDSEDVCKTLAKYCLRVYLWRNLKPTLYSTRE